MSKTVLCFYICLKMIRSEGTGVCLRESEIPDQMKTHPLKVNYQQACRYRRNKTFYNLHTLFLSFCFRNLWNNVGFLIDYILSLNMINDYVATKFFDGWKSTHSFLEAFKKGSYLKSSFLHFYLFFTKNTHQFYYLTN